MSLVSSALEWLAAAHLLSRGRLHDREYGLFITTIATMETCQMLLWFAIDYDNTPLNKIISLLLWADAWVCIPFSIVNFVTQPSRGTWSTRQRFFGAYFAAQAFVVLALMAASNEWITIPGPNHHQIWPCAAALAWTAGHMVCMVSCLVYVIFIALSLLPLEPRMEMIAFLTIGVLTFTPSYLTLGPTLEACSVWCWSAGSYSIYFLLRGVACLQSDSWVCQPFVIREQIADKPQVPVDKHETETLTSEPSGRPGLRSRAGSRSSDGGL